MKWKLSELCRKVKNSFQLKVLVSILLPTVIFTVLTNIVVGTLLGQQLMKKRSDVDRGYLSVVCSYLQDAKDNLDTLALLTESSSGVKWTMMRSALDSVEAKRNALSAQDTLTASLSANPLSVYVDDMIVVNSKGMQISVTESKKMIPAEQILSCPILKDWGEDDRARCWLTESLSDPGRTVLAYAYPLDMQNGSFLYMELDTQLFTDILQPYGESVNMVIRSTRDGNAWFSSGELAKSYEQEENSGAVMSETASFEPFSVAVDVVTEDIYSPDVAYVVTVLLITAVFAVGLGITVSRLLSSRITKPLRHLSGHISLLTDQNELTEEKSIEEGADEIAGIGRAFNRLVRHINNLIREQKEMFEQKQRMEMNALQAQINPHFLYNTLDSIRWMAVIRKAGNIADTVMSLENLLRNMAKGAGNKITLLEELSLADDYVNLQQVRYMGIFDYECDVPKELLSCRIVKMTMQPIIENAIFHGIEPTGTYGVIRVSAKREGKDLYISVEDNGVGSEPEELKAFMYEKKNKNAMSGIGIGNVDERLKMTYGKQYGLICEGKKGSFTRITIHIPAEQDLAHAGADADKII